MYCLSTWSVFYCICTAFYTYHITAVTDVAPTAATVSALHCTDLATNNAMAHTTACAATTPATTTTTSNFKATSTDKYSINQYLISETFYEESNSN